MLAEGKSIRKLSMMVMCRVDIKVTQTNDIGVLLNVISQIDISKRLCVVVNQILDGEADFLNAIKVAQLSLKHRQNKS